MEFIPQLNISNEIVVKMAPQKTIDNHWVKDPHIKKLYNFNGTLSTTDEKILNLFKRVLQKNFRKNFNFIKLFF